MNTPVRLSPQGVTDAVLAGLNEAVKGYFNISGWYLYNNEAFICSTIARSIHKKYRNRGIPLWVTLEAPNKQLKEFVKQPSGRKPKVLEGNPRFDIVVWNGDDPYCVIEVKSNPTSRSTAQRNKDVERIKALLNNRENPKFGLFAYYIRYARPSTYKENSDRLVNENKSASGFNFKLVREKVRIKYEGAIEDLGEVCVLKISNGDA